MATVVFNSVLSNGNMLKAIPTAIITARKVMINVSLKNWNINCCFLLPNTFRTPTSLARLTACAVARFIKLIQAIISRKSPIRLKAVISSLLKVRPL